VVIILRLLFELKRQYTPGNFRVNPDKGGIPAKENIVIVNENFIFFNYTLYIRYSKYIECLLRMIYPFSEIFKFLDNCLKLD
jgi:hypothetical protein